MAAFILFSVFLGFAQSYYLQGVLKLPEWKAFAAPPHPLLVHVHAMIFSSWILLLVAQTSLVAAGRLDLHRRLGAAGFGLACLLVLVGLAVTCEFLSRHHSHEEPGLRFPFLQVVDLTVFSSLIYFGYRLRFNPAAHKWADGDSDGCAIGRGLLALAHSGSGEWLARRFMLLRLAGIAGGL